MQHRTKTRIEIRTWATERGSDKNIEKLDPEYLDKTYSVNFMNMSQTVMQAVLHGTW